jgi:biopolymer transport protein ExbD
MPDLIFTVLFFFMIATHARDITPQVKAEEPKGELAVRVPHKSAVVEVMIGKKDGSWLVQVENSIVPIEQVGEAVQQARARLSEEDQERVMVAIRADRQTPYGLVARVKRKLREAGTLDISYIVHKEKGHTP